MSERRGRKPDPGREAARLSEEEVERRLGGDAGLGGPVEPRPPATAPTPYSEPPRGSRGRGLLWRDAGFALGLLALLFVGARFALNWQPTGAAATSTPGASEVALASESAGATASEAPIPTVGPSATPFVVIPSLPTPTATATPRTVPTPTPTPTAAPPTPRPTATPGFATLDVIVHVDPPQHNGNDVAGDWTVSVSGAGASPSSFKGSESGTAVKIRAGQSYSVTTKAGTTNGYTQVASSGCAGKAATGATRTCTFEESDRAAGVAITVVLNGASDTNEIDIWGQHPDPATCTVSDTGLCWISASVTPRTVRFDSNRPSYQVLAGNLGGTPTYSADCSGGTLDEGEIRSCTITYSSGSASVGGGVGGTWFLTASLLPAVRIRRRFARQAA